MATEILAADSSGGIDISSDASEFEGERSDM
jgi:hypothetical protein